MAGTSPKAPAARNKSVKALSGPKVSHAAQPKSTVPTVSSDRNHGLEVDEVEEAVGGTMF